ncbi:hypothetical protein DSM106972_047060 [Dulcicalothrix desertica PCC 7102]|uniref:Uncharacterized protein n=1 Tax=Dulcicalothrix desertica PCC 7102 TaxID=232991 RepID=A0A3S1D5A8_9CYAN|nr:M23 family peptidase [Dulcicalothrix desertica]RUT03792.1 hypothetical protein DSM106972_047060 [Dulcicalothrix desertica PCC 7102]TWH43800.1 hypothetical protein CAL7102_07544 [Dulcicalothrix desertica PCC 7102]
MKIGRFLAVTCLSLCVVIFSWFSFYLAPPSIAQNQPNLPTRLTASSTGAQLSLPDWQRISFATMPPIQKGASINIDGKERKWEAGDTPDKYLSLSDIEDALQPSLLSLDSITKTVSNLNLKTVPLISFPLLGQQTLQNLADIVPNLGQANAAQIKPIAALLKTQAPQTNIDTPLSNLLAQNQTLAELKLNQTDLSSYTVEDIPNVDAVQLSNFSGWQNTLIYKVPGLGALPLTEFPIPLSELGNTFARIDFIWGKAEKRRQRTISGSDVAGFSVPCSDQECPYIELDDLENLGRRKGREFEGRSWISGKYQQVEGGWGCLEGVNGGKEPTGRLPFGSAFKVVVMEPDEKTDTVDTALFFRFKNICGATPYFMGPVPFLTYKLNAPIFIGTLGSELSQNTYTPKPNSSEVSTNASKTNTVPVNNSTQPNCELNQGSQTANLMALAKSIADTENNGNYNDVGAYACTDDESNCGVSLGKYKFLSYDKYTQEQIQKANGGQDFLAKLSQGYRPNDAEVFQFFPPLAQEDAFQNSIADKINSTSQEIDPVTKKPFSGARLVERVAQKYFGGDSSIVDSDAKDVFGRLSIKNYGEDVLSKYNQNYQGC